MTSTDEPVGMVRPIESPRATIHNDELAAASRRRRAFVGASSATGGDGSVGTVTDARW